jgi:hypothetical protein
MSETDKDKFWQYANEAVLAACHAESDDEKQGLLDLARTWTQAAMIERHSGQYRQHGSRCVVSPQLAAPSLAENRSAAGIYPA